jgi:16S rRNA (uracil1498-N3)-methyltransferase
VHDPFFFTDGPLVPGPSGSDEASGRLPGESDPIVLRGGDAHHLTVVRRARVGDRVCVSDGAGTVVEGRVASLGPSVVEVERLTERRVERSAPAVRVFQALAKGAKVELVVQKLVELGADGIVVFTSGRSVPRWDPRKRAQMAARWATIAREAAKQSRRAWLPDVTGPVSTEDAAEEIRHISDGGLVLLADESSATPLRDVLPGPLGAAREVALVVGPEGGLTATERATFVEAGAVAFSLGPQILRTETAALATSALVLHHAGRLG